MDERQWKRISRIVDLALAMPENRRATYIQNLCTNNTELQLELSALLQSLDDSESLLSQHLKKNEALLKNFASHLEETSSSFKTSLLGETVDQWKLVEVLGHGGMGSVYKAERIESGIKQTGALKIMHKNLKSPKNIQRFRLEHQILAGLSHPNIASRIDGGVSKDGLPYLVMEYIKGKSILKYCNANQLSIQERIPLFGQVCKAVEYAHKNLIVHRDLKPENIWVTDEEHIKILDFGIAKLLDPDLYNWSATETRQGMRPMSLEYAAPEQVSGETITTSTDVYSLGILLYELLSGTHPFRGDEEGVGAIKKMVTSKEPPLPSQRILDAQNLASIAKNRKLEPKELKNSFRGDLDAIINKALRKEPDQRYESVGQLSEDLDRYIANKPVSARYGSTRYRISKFLKRHKKGISIAATAAIVITALTIFYTLRLTQERNEAQLEAEKTEQVKDLLVDIFRSGNPLMDPNAKNLTVQEVLKRGTREISNSLEGQPLIKAELQEALGNVYSGLVMYPQAEPLLRQALSTYRQNLGANHPDVAKASCQLGFMLFRKGEYRHSETLFKKAKHIYLENYGAKSSQYAYTLTLLGNLFSETGRSKQALDYFDNAIQIYKQTGAPEIAGALMDRGYLLMDLNRLDDAQLSLNQAISLFKQYYNDPDAAVANALTGLGQTMQLKGNLSKAEKYHRQALKIRQEIFDPGHTYIASSHLRLGWVLVEQDRIKEAVLLVQKAYDSFKNHLPDKHWKIAASKGVLALAWIRQGKFAKAQKSLLNTYGVFKEQFGKKDWRTQSARQTLAKLYLAWDKPQKAEKYLNQ